MNIDTGFHLEELIFFVLSYLFYKIQNESVISTVEHFPFKWWHYWETTESWQPLQEKHMKNILGTASHETRLFLESPRN